VNTGGRSLRVEVDRLTKAFGTSGAIAGVSFAARDHDFVTLVGPSGCGKSTIPCAGGVQGEPEGRDRTAFLDANSSGACRSTS